MSLWHEMAVQSHYQTALAVREALGRGSVIDAQEGLTELIDALGRSDTRSLRSQMLRLMAHIIKWKTQPERRSISWCVSIENARIEIEELIEAEPHLRPTLPILLDELFSKAQRLAEKEMNKHTSLTELVWSEVFEDDYALTDSTPEA
jgi:hypothetical protein